MEDLKNIAGKKKKKPVARLTAVTMVALNCFAGPQGAVGT